MQLLWINVFLDIAAVVAIATGTPIDSLLLTGPYNISDKILTREMLIEILFLSFYQISMLLSILLMSDSILSLPYTWSTPAWVTEDLIKDDPLYSLS